MLKFGSIVVTLFSLAVILFGLGYTTYEALLVAPEAHEGARGRIIDHTKNVTRLPAIGSDDASAAALEARLLDAIETDPRPPHVIVAPGGSLERLAFALPAAYWAAYARVPLVLVGEDGALTPADRARLMDAAAVIVLAPAGLVSAGLASDPAVGDRPVVRVAGATPAAQAVAVAKAWMPEIGFGWGRTPEADNGYFHYVVASPADLSTAIAALPLARSNAATLLFAGADRGLPAETDVYVWPQRSDWFTTPSEGPFRHFWIAGPQISYDAQGRLDFAVEKAAYATRGALALGPMDAVAIAFVALGLAGGGFVFLHGLRVLPDVMLPMRLAWTMTALLVPVIGVVVYLKSYAAPSMKMPAGPHFERANAWKAASGTAMGFGFGAPLMVAIAYLFLWFGLPLYYGDWSDEWTFLAGAGMPIMMASMYVLAILIAWLFVQGQMRRHSGGSFAGGLGVTVLSMSAVSLGMMTLAWWIPMTHIPMMPKEDDIVWFGQMFLASTVGFLVAWPLNWPMVRSGLKMGGM